MEVAIGKRFKIDPELLSCTELKRADLQLLIDEQQVLMVTPPEPWPDNAPPAKDPSRIQCWNYAQAKQQFLARYKELT